MPHAGDASAAVSQGNSSVNRVPVRLRVRRTSGWQEYLVDISPDAYVLDAIEAAGARDASLLFRHSCHHASCGSCGVRINGREGLPCITPLRPLINGGRTLRVEPLRNFPIIGDLLVDFGPFMRKLDSVGLPLRREAEAAVQTPNLKRIPDSSHNKADAIPDGFNRLENCIECGLCVSACPVAGPDPFYSGPAMLAAAGRVLSEPRQRDTEAVMKLVDQEHGLWRCHGAFECSEVCPAGVDPAREIMGLRSRLLQSGVLAKPKGNP